MKDDTLPCEICTTRMEPWSLPRANVLLRCPECGHIIRRLDLCLAAARESAWSGDARLDRIRLGLTFRRIQKLTGCRDRVDVLELGVGGGHLTARLLDRGHAVCGLDLDLSRVPEAIRRRSALWETTAEQANLPAGQFDLVVAVHVAEHLSDPAFVMQQCLQALRPGGTLYLVTPNAASASLRLFKNAWWMLEDPTHVRFFSARSVTKLLETTGFCEVQSKAAWWDSLGVEVNSIRRRFALRRTGVLTGLVPIALACRLIHPALAPCMEVVACKPMAKR